MSPKDPNLPIIGGIVAAVGAGLCCAGPFILLLLGVSGSWIGNLTLLETLSSYFHCCGIGSVCCRRSKRLSPNGSM